MRPNIVMIGFFNLHELRKKEILIDVQHQQPPKLSQHKPDLRKGESSKTISKNRPHGAFPTDSNKRERAIDAQSYVTVLEDLIRGIKANVAVAKGFEKFKIPEPPVGLRDRLRSWSSFKESQPLGAETRYIDLWPVQMSAFAFIDTEDHEQKRVLTSNFDTYTLILQLGAVLSTADGYQQKMKLRVSAFVEYENEVEQEKQRVESLLVSLRIVAEVRVFWLACGDLKTYEVIVNGVKGDDYDKTHQNANETLRDEIWWQEVQSFRKEELSALRDLAELQGDNFHGSLPNKPRQPNEAAVRRLQRLLRKAKRRISKSGMDDLQSQMRVQLSHLDPDLIASYDNPDSSGDETSEVESTTGSITPSVINSPISAQSLSGRGRGQSPNRIAGLITPQRPSHDRTGSKNSFSAPIAIHNKGIVSDMAMLSASSPRNASRALGSGAGIYSPLSGSASPRRPPPMRHQSLPKFTSHLVPATKIMHDDGSGRSIMFEDPQSADDEATTRDEQPSSVTASSDANAAGDEDTNPLPPAGGFPATGLTRSGSAVSMGATSAAASQNPKRAASEYPAQRAMPMSFNDLPSRAQHLILNELIAQNSAQAAVLFTTLPGPAEGTGENEEDSVRYLTDLEVLCQGLPPVMLVHSNTVTVTVSL
jgi:potassium/chloride transporter 9